MLETWRTLMWLTAFATSAWVYWRATKHCRARFVSSLWAGATLAHVGANLLANPSVPGALGQLFDLQDATVLLLPLGALAIAPFREALIALPLGLAVARLGCLPASCCYEAPWATLAESTAFVLLHFVATRSRHSTLRVLTGFGGIRLVAELSGLRVSHEPWLVEPCVIAFAWIAIGILLRNRVGSAAGEAEWFTERTRPALISLALMLGVWLLFPVAMRVAPDPQLAFVAASLVAAAIVVCTCAPPVRALADRRRLAFTITGATLGFGIASWWRHSIALAGFATPLAGESAARSIAVALSIVVLAPVFEELLYRGRLLTSFRQLWGPFPPSRSAARSSRWRTSIPRRCSCPSWAASCAERWCCARARSPSRSDCTQAGILGHSRPEPCTPRLLMRRLHEEKIRSRALGPRAISISR